MVKHFPAYLKAFETGVLEERAAQAAERLEACHLCPRHCGVNRRAGDKGVCQSGEKAVVSSFNPHFGEEAELVGTHGSGTLFFTHCNLLCNFCQNNDISHGGEGQEVSSDQLAWIMLELQRMGCHNINLVTPSHMVAPILAALVIAAEKGLRLPLVYNTGGYDRVETLRLLDGVVDIYMPDFKFWDPAVADMICHAPDYPAVARRALSEMHRQVGDLMTDEKGRAFRGLLVRHLVMPRNMAGTEDVMEFIARDISPSTFVNIMSQYRPCGPARNIDGLNRPVTREEYREALAAAAKAGLGWVNSSSFF
jgi:putative pyruvate formate lyase activating enzyme